ncbi:MAG: DUF4491 family protein [Paludibacteraceae bacterium]|jgi:hypothetical protein|nr:DUF4491 family protein [Paludibacteraceae bacterium]MBQ2591589.1 DUF4491 family protein [Paludibacteraceae bacterium]MBQ3896292.1 DUF4491 family protein [Paludibacteraceae bacterium]MBR2178421.1 DUF4491 family protein [Paludibacteraceae bacterium]MBR6077137.1 DUF4491 family protein [Paludibacteraceae bacterium]
MDLNFSGLAVGVSLFLMIGIFHPVVIKAEYYYGTKCWPAFAASGIAAVAASLLIEDFIVSTIFATLAFSLFWSILELFQQKKRVERGWFPMNPKRKDQYDIKKK